MAVRLLLRYQFEILLRWDVVEADQVDILSFTVLGNFEQIDYAQETRLARELRGDVRQADGFDRVDLDLTLLHLVTAAGGHPWTGPETDGRRDFSAPNTGAQPLGEGHSVSLEIQDNAYRFAILQA